MLYRESEFGDSRGQQRVTGEWDAHTRRSLILEPRLRQLHVEDQQLLSAPRNNCNFVLYQPFTMQAYHLQSIIPETRPSLEKQPKLPKLVVQYHHSH